MSTGDLRHAPPAKSVDGLTAVPIDIQRITASLTFDGATASGLLPGLALVTLATVAWAASILKHIIGRDR